ncbi:DUF3098 domain-containing protein [Flaviaesturariibacter amylovorans]|uniref:DUF3098 domain-containing protein n=1 Tax=Flaviaesturariibacter amylovorans TaxID=1084520 RepID=A0ABP8G5X5_9BACT
MKSKRSPLTEKETLRLSDKPLFGRENLLWMAIGAAVIILGFLLMAGGGSDDPNVFNKDEVYGTRRITIAPIVILIGLVIEIYALFRKPRIVVEKTTTSTTSTTV